MKKILVCTDGSIISQKAIDTSIELQGLYKNDVILYSNIKDGGVGLTDVNMGNINPEYLKYFQEKRKDDTNARRELLNAIVEKYPYPDKVKTYVDVGETSNRIVDLAKKENVDLIILGNRGLGKAKQILLGSVSKYVSQNAPMSVLIVR